MAAWEKRDMLSASAFPPYALTIVKNKCLNHLRSQGVRLRAAEDIHSTVRACSEPASRPSKPATLRNCSARRRGGW